MISRLLPIGFSKSGLSRRMRDMGLSALLLTSPENVYYTTGYTTLPTAGNAILYMLRNRLPFFSLITANGHVTLLCWKFSAWNMEFGADTVIGFNDRTEGLAAVREAVQAALVGGGTLGIESSCPYVVLDAIGALGGGISPIVADSVIDGLRLIKTGAEVACLRRSIDIIEKTCGELLNVLSLGMSRTELTQQAKERLIRNGADGISHLTFSFGQANPEFNLDEPLEPNRLVTLDLGGIYRGYCSDNRRYAYSGRVTDGLRSSYDSMVAIVDDVGAALIPGTPYKRLMELSYDLYRKHGLDPLPRFNHVGHNIGLETEERWIDDDPDSRVEAGMVINIELYTIAPSGDQVGDEETYVIGEHGSTRVSTLPREIREIA